ncbi:hypothetical protein [Pontivivens ytuae]|uniref:Type II toxin-antitoxin system PemK/MazF family toxin n=1 Tax=Pontivivens ytuae TaxID=2789856 RepID=A0A7S9QDB6_9RHOB|nr:hypothetical protein [Pontivivens ytuae]QPH53961.1 hypothetical protein I0K15_19665 [Pontivivens ytuae]
MLHSTPIPDPKMTADWRDHLEPGDVVSFRFPLAEEDDVGRPKARPCLVLDVERSGDDRRVVLAYGTTSRRKTNIGYETHVRTRGDRLAAGLDRSTRFVGKRRLSVSLQNGGFAICGTASTQLSRLSSSACATATSPN